MRRSRSPPVSVSRSRPTDLSSSSHGRNGPNPSYHHRPPFHNRSSFNHGNNHHSSQPNNLQHRRLAAGDRFQQRPLFHRSTEHERPPTAFRGQRQPHRTSFTHTQSSARPLSPSAGRGKVSSDRSTLSDSSSCSKQPFSRMNTIRRPEARSSLKGRFVPANCSKVNSSSSSRNNKSVESSRRTQPNTPSVSGLNPDPAEVSATDSSFSQTSPLVAPPSVVFPGSSSSICSLQSASLDLTQQQQNSRSIIPVPHHIEAEAPPDTTTTTTNTANDSLRRLARIPEEEEKKKPALVALTTSKSKHEPLTEKAAEKTFLTTGELHAADRQSGVDKGAEETPAYIDEEGAKEAHSERVAETENDEGEKSASESKGHSKAAYNLLPPGEREQVQVGTRVAVYWKGDGLYFEGVVRKDRPFKKKRFFVQYDDGDEEWLSLTKLPFYILNGGKRSYTHKDWVNDDDWVRGAVTQTRSSDDDSSNISDTVGDAVESPSPMKKKRKKKGLIASPGDEGKAQEMSPELVEKLDVPAADSGGEINDNQQDVEAVGEQKERNVKKKKKKTSPDMKCLVRTSFDGPDAGNDVAVSLPALAEPKKLKKKLTLSSTVEKSKPETIPLKACGESLSPNAVGLDHGVESVEHVMPPKKKRKKKKTRPPVDNESAPEEHVAALKQTECLDAEGSALAAEFVHIPISEKVKLARRRNRPSDEMDAASPRPAKRSKGEHAAPPKIEHATTKEAASSPSTQLSDTAMFKERKRKRRIAEVQSSREIRDTPEDGAAKKATKSHRTEFQSSREIRDTPEDGAAKKATKSHRTEFQSSREIRDTPEDGAAKKATKLMAHVPSGVLKVKKTASSMAEAAPAHEFKKMKRRQPKPVHSTSAVPKREQSRPCEEESSPPVEPVSSASDADAKRRKEEARTLTPAEVAAILGEEDPCGDSANWVRRSARMPSRSALMSPNTQVLLQSLRANDPEVVVLKMKRYVSDPAAPPVVIDAVLDALEENTNCESLYIQNYNEGMRDAQVLRLLGILQNECCNIWCLNIGETYKVKRKTWKKFAKGLKHTKITHMYASEHTISPELKEYIRTTIRENRSKHNMHVDPENLDTIVRCTHCWWNPINAKVLRPYLRAKGYEHILHDKEAQGARGSKSAEKELV